MQIHFIYNLPDNDRSKLANGPWRISKKDQYRLDFEQRHRLWKRCLGNEHLPIIFKSNNHNQVRHINARLKTTMFTVNENCRTFSNNLGFLIAPKARPILSFSSWSSEVRYNSMNWFKVLSSALTNTPL